MDESGVLFLVGLICGFALGIMIGHETTDRSWRKEAIDHKVGQYNPQTAKFEWITPKPERAP